METARSELYFRGDKRTSSVLCLASRYLGMAVSAVGLDSLILQAGGSTVKLAMTRELHINNRVYRGGGGEKESITFLQKGQYFNRADVECHPFTDMGEIAPVQSRFEICCVGDILQVASNFVMKQETSVGVAVIRLKGGNPVDDGKNVYYLTDEGKIYVSGASGGIIEVCEDQLIVKQPIMSASDGDDCSVALRFCATQSMLFTSPPLAIYVEARRNDKPIRAEFDRKRSVYCINDEQGSGPLELYLENPYDAPICMPFMVTRRSDKPLGAVLKQNGEQTGLAVQACCERIHRGSGWTAFCDFTVAPVIPARTRVAFSMEFLENTSACHLWTHNDEAQLSRVELYNNGGGCVLDLMRSLRGVSVPTAVSFADKDCRKFDIIKIFKDQARLDLCRVRLTDLFCGELESYATHQAYTPERGLKMDVRVGVIKSDDYTRINVKLDIDVLADVKYEHIQLISLEGKGFYVGDGISISCICPNEGEGLSYAMRLEQDEFVGFDNIGVILRKAEGRSVDMRLFSCENGESYARAELCLSGVNNFYKDEKLCFEFTVVLIPDAESYIGSDNELAKSLNVRTGGQIMRREAAANRVETVAITGQGSGEIFVEDDTAQAMQSGGLGVSWVRFAGLSDIKGKRVTLQDGTELPIQAELDKKGGYKLLALIEHPEKKGERKVFLK